MSPGQPEHLEEDIGARAALFEAQVNSSLDGILVVDSDNRKVLQNPRMTDLLRIPQEIADDPDDMKQRLWVMGVVKDPEHFIEKISHLNSHPDEISRDELELKDGRVLDRYSSPVIGKDGKYHGRIWTFRDITARKKTETALLETEEKLRQLADNITDMFWMRSPDLETIHYVNIGYELIWGRSIKSLYANPQERFDAILPEDRQRVRAAYASLRKDKARMGIEYRIARPDGSVRWVHDRGFQIRDAAGSLVRLAGIATDITERKEAESQVLLQSAALEAAANGIVITDGQGNIQWVNRAFTVLTGYSAAEAVGKSPNILKSGKNDDAFYQKLWSTIYAGKAWKGELINRRKDSTLYTEEMTITPIRSDAGDTTHFIAVKQDVTRRKTLESKLVDLSRQAGMAEVATGVLHNVGNVLNSLNISANLLLEHVRATPVADLERVVGLLRNQGANLGAFFTDDPRAPRVLDFLSSLAEMLKGLQEAGFKEVASLQKNTDHIRDIVVMQQGYARLSGLTERVNLPDLVEDTLRINIATFQRDAVRVVRRFAPDLPPVTTEKHKVLQILVNLVNNARTACQESPRPDKEITVRVTHSGGRVKIHVIDNGMGIRPENLARIFNHGFTTRKAGHGFGLHNSANAAVEIGGSLAVHSDGPGLGATFTLELPVERSQADVKYPLAGVKQD